MAEAYRGLTIRLGADASDLVKSLRYTSSAISDTQRQLRSLQKAAKIDPDGMRALGLQADVTADKALGLTKKVRTLNEVIKKAESSKEFREIGGDLEYASTKAADAKARYAQLCEEIKRLKNEYAKLAGYNDLDNNDPFKGVEGVRDTIAVMERLASENEQAAQSFDEVAAKYKELANLHGIAQKEKELAEFAVEVRNAKVDMAAASAEANQFYRELAKLSLNPKVANTEEFIELSGRIKRCTQAVDELKAETRELDKALDIDPSNMDAARLKMASMLEQVNLNIQKMKDLRLQMARLEDSGADKLASDMSSLRMEIMRTEDQAAKLNAEFLNAKAALDKLENATDGKTEAELRQAREEAARLENELAQCKERLDQLGQAKLYGKLSSELSSVSSSTYRLAQDMTQAEGRTRAFSGAMQQLGWSAYSTLTPAITIFAHQAIASAEDVDASYRNMRKTVQGTEEQFEALKQAAIDYSRTHFTSADQLLEIEALGGQLGVAVEDLEDFATVVSNLEIATDLDAETAATQLGQLRGITKMTADEFDSYGDALVRLGNNNATMESKISDVMLRISSMGTIVGMTVPELLAWSTAVASTGQGAESAGTAISNTMSDIETAVSSGGDELQKFAEIAQMSADEFARAWDEDPSSAMKAFIEGLNSIEDAGGSADAALGELGINGVRQKQAILGLMQTIEGLNDNLQMSNDAWNGVSDKWGAAGDAAREAERKAEGFSGSIQLLRNNAQAFATELGESLAPAIDMAADAIAGLTQWYSDLPEAGKQALNIMLLFGAALGPVTVGVNGISNAWRELKGLFTGSRSAWRLAQRDTALVTETLSQLGVVATGTAGDTKKMNDEVKKSGTAARLASKGLSILKGAAGALGTGLLIVGVGEFIEYLQDADEKARNLAKATDGLEGALDAVDPSIRNAADAVNSMNTDSAVREVGELTAEIDNAIEKQAELATTMEQDWGEINASSSSLQTYLDVIEQLTGKVDSNGKKVALNAEEQAKLRAAVEGVNQIMGTNIEVVDAVNGSLSSSIADIDAQAEAWKRNAEQAAYAAEMNELVARNIENKGLLEDAQSEYDRVKALYDEAEKNPTTIGSYNPYFEELAKKEEDLRRIRETADSSAAAVEEFTKRYADSMRELAQVDMTDALKGLGEDVQAVFEGIDVESLAGQLSDLGASTVELKDLSADSWRQIVSAYQESPEALSAALENLGITFDATAADMLEARNAMVDAITGMGPEMTETLSSMGVDIQDFAEKLVDAGLTSDQVKTLVSGNFATLAQDCGYDIDQIIGKIVEMNGTDLEDKDANIEAHGNVPSGDAKSKVKDTNWQITNLNGKDVWVNVNGNYNDARIQISGLSDAIGSIGSKTVDIVTNFVSRVHQSQRAEGGILQRYHATGAIVHKPTQITPLDIAGEDGAEAIIPLTNKRYVAPFARTVAEEFGASRDFEKLYAETLYARSVAESMSHEIRRAMGGFATQQAPSTAIGEVNINQRVVTPQEDIYVAAPAMARSAMRELRKL